MAAVTAATDEDTTEAVVEVVEGEAEEVDPTKVPPVGVCISTSAKWTTLMSIFLSFEVVW